MGGGTERMFKASVEPEKIKAFISHLLSQQQLEVVETVQKMKKQDLTLEPGFNITAEYRLGEIRGYNKALDHILQSLSTLTTLNNK